MELVWRAGRGAISLITNKYTTAPSRQNPPAASSGTTKEPLVIFTISPVKEVVTMPARLAAKFWMPPMEATWAGEGATSAGRDQMLAAVKARLP